MRTSPTSIGTPGRPPATMQRDARELLLNSATELFAAQGIASTTLAMIAKRVKLTPAMLNYYFKDRDQLLDAMMEERISRIVSHIWDAVPPYANAADTIRGMVERLLEVIEQAPWVPSLWIREVLNEDGLLRERMLRHLPYEKVRFLTDAIARGQADGSLNPDLDPLLTVSSTLGLVVLNMAAAKIWAQSPACKSPNRPTMRRHIVGLLLDGLCHKDAAKSKMTSRKKSGR